MTRLTCIAAPLTLALSTVAHAQFELCEIDPATIAGAPRFADYAVSPGPADPPHAAVITRADRGFRTMIRRGAAKGPNFAGHYTVAGWGCGSSCVFFSIIDARTGRVFSDRVVNEVVADRINNKAPPYEYYGLAYRRDSRLLALTGAVGEQQARTGVSYFTWSGRAFRLVRFIPVAALCPPR